LALAEELQWVLTMPVKCHIDREIISDKDFQVITLIYLNQRSRILTIDEIDLAIDTIFETVSFDHPNDGGYLIRRISAIGDSIPGALDALWMVKL